MKKSTTLAALIALCLLSNIFVVSAMAQQAAVGFDDLQAAIGSDLEDGTGVTSAQVEASSGDAYASSPANPAFQSTVFADGTGTNVGSTGHATTVGIRMYGSGSIASGLGRTDNPVTSFSAVDFLVTQSNVNSGSDPEPFNFDVANHSYILNQPVGLSDAQATNLLQRLDFMADEGESTMCVGVNNGSGNILPEFLAYMHNAISVGVTDGGHSSGTTQTATSFATPLVTSSAAILHEAGSGTDATRTETIRALLLSGATKDEADFEGEWDRTTTRPLDEIYGAGELNIFNSYMSLKGGEFNGSTVDPVNAVGLNGWDYESQISSGNALFYEFEVAQGTQLDELSIVLCWNMEIIDQSPFGFLFSPVENLGNLSLDFYDSSGSFLGSLLDESKSPVDNVEHIYLKDLPAGTYHLRVSSDTNRDFGLAWRSTSSIDNNTVATLTFSGPYTEQASGSLIDGNYRLTINGNGVVDSQGNNYDVDGDGNPSGVVVLGDQADDGFYRLFGDIDSDREVSIFDFFSFRSAFSIASGDPLFESGFDSDADGVISIFDFFRVSQNLGSMLPFE